MKLEKFDLEKVIHGAKVVTRDGREVTQLTKFEISCTYSLVGVVHGRIYYWTVEGIWHIDIQESEMDLFLAVEPKSIWINISLSDKGKLLTSSGFGSKQEAIENICPYYSYLKTIEITDESDTTL